MKFTTLSISTLLLAAVTATSALAAKLETKQARKNDYVDAYHLLSGIGTNNRLFRNFNGRPCEIDRNVKHFKVSIHPNDKSMVYYIKRERDVFGEPHDNLYMVRNVDNVDKALLRLDICPEAETKLLMTDVKFEDSEYKYNVTASTKTDIVLTALNRNGDLNAWDNDKVVLSSSNIDTYKLNKCNDQDGKKYQTYLIFAAKKDGRILKVNGDHPDTKSDITEKKYFKNKAGFAGANEPSIEKFQEKEKVCSDLRRSPVRPGAPGFENGSLEQNGIAD